jgi:hypothetical protein
MVVQERLVARADFVDALGDAGQERQIATDVGLQIQAGDFGPRTAGFATHRAS